MPVKPRRFKSVLSRAREERGAAMASALGMLAAAMLIMLAAHATVTGDLPLAAGDQDRKEAYSAAEAGIHYYAYNLVQDNAYWLKCTNVPDPDGTGPDPSPVVQAWSGSGPDPRDSDPQPSGLPDNHWRNLPNSEAQYAIELLPAAGYAPAQCDEGIEESMRDPSNGTFRIRSTGRAFATGPKRSIVATFKRKSFLDYLWFTEYETLAPLAYDPSDQDEAAAKCVKHKYAGRPSFNPCREIQWPDYDQVLGPFHSNDSIYVCGSPDFGRAGESPPDSIESTGTRWGGCSAGAIGPGTWKPYSPRVDMPPSNNELKTIAGRTFTGETTIELNGSSMQVTNLNLVPPVQTFAFPSNGLVYVDTGGGTCDPYDGDALPDLTCGNAKVSGTYSQDLTIATSNDIIINGDLKRTSSTNGKLLGLIPNNFARIYHPVLDTGPTCTNLVGTMTNVQIDAAILALTQSFLVDKWDCGARLGTLTVNGSIAQKFRGPVGVVGTHGYTKNYNYDDGLRYREPPHFLSPVETAWQVRRQVEQSPAR